MSIYLTRYIGADRLPGNLSDVDLDVYFRLPADTIDAIKSRFRADRHPGVENRMVAMAAQVVFLRTTGRPLDHVTRLPRSLLRYLGTALGVRPPTIASLRSMYRRRETAFEHQRWAREHLGLANATPATFADLKEVLLAHAKDAVSVDELVTAAAQWLFDKKIVVPADRALRDFARNAYADVERCAIRAIKAAISAKHRSHCRACLFSRHPTRELTMLEWLSTPPRRHSPSTLEETLAKVRYLKDLRADTWNLDSISPARQEAYAHAIASRPPSDSRRRRDDTQLLEVICFLRVTLFDLTDSVLMQAGRRISDFTRQAAQKTQTRQATRSTTFRECLVSIREILSDQSRTATQRLKAIEDAVADLGDLTPVSHAADVREALTAEPSRVHTLLEAVAPLEFKGNPKQMALRQLAALRELRKAGASALPKGSDVPVRKMWRGLIDGDDRKRAFKALEASAALELRRALRGGAVWVEHSRMFREREQMLIPTAEWERDRDRYAGMLALPATADEYFPQLMGSLKDGLAAVADAKKGGAVTIDDHGFLHLEKLGAVAEDTEPQRLRDFIFKQIGDVQFPDLMLEVDAQTNFSEALLGHRAGSEQELVAVYAGLLAHGTEMDAKSVAAMIPQLDPGHVAGAMRALESETRVRKAIQRVVAFQLQHPITHLWGSGELASSDSMSLDATHNLWLARVDPRRRTYGVGMYTHVLDRHCIVYHQPVVLNERQAGPAIQGALAYNAHAADRRLTRLAVDTHGYTYPGTSLGAFAGIALCPRLADIPERKLYLPRDVDVPDGLEPVVVRDVSLGVIRAEWDAMRRTTSSILSGRVDAAALLQRLGSAAKGDRLYEALTQLGKLLRTLFFCDYFSNREFRRELHTVLDRGESVHQLQRAIYTGKIAPERARRRDELMAISGAHTLLTNLVIAWNTHHMQQVVDKLRRQGVHKVEDELLAHMGPAHFGNINLRGILSFRIARYRENLLKWPGMSDVSSAFSD